jgi:hypothetical protein
MTRGEPVQSPRRGRAAGAALLAVAVVPFLGPLFGPVGADVTDRTIRASAYPPVVLWCVAWPALLLRRPWWPLGRPLWAVGCACLWLHVALAFHLGHAWSHAAAWERTRQESGYGDGIFVSYAFALVWLADAVGAWAAPGWYAARPRWLHAAVHGFLAFVVFNAAVVFAGPSFRAVALAAALGGPPVLAVLVAAARRRTESRT